MTGDAGALGRIPRIFSFMSIRTNEIYMAYAESLGQFIKRDDSRVALTSLKVAEILLAETRTCFHLLLRQTDFTTQPGEVPS